MVMWPNARMINSYLYDWVKLEYVYKRFMLYLVNVFEALSFGVTP